MTRDLWIGRPFHGHLAGYPSVDVKSVGAGGGSLATIDKAGLLHVGPQSAGSYPGPVCYGRGGTGPTVSDACLVLGFLDPDFFLGGKMKLDAPAARAAIAEQIAEPLGLSVEEAAWSVVDLATENMVQAIAELTVNQGIDPSEAVLVGGGGAAGLNSVFIARRLGCRQLLIPETGAAMSAAGAMMSDIVTDFAATVYSKTDAFDAARVNAVLDGLRAKAEAYAAEAGLPSRLEFIAEARYEGQAWDIDVPLTFERFVTDADVTAFRGDFDRAHEQLFTIRDEESSVELIGLRVTVRCGARTEEGFILRAGDEEAAGERSRPVYFAGSGAIETPILAWSKLKAGLQQAGPAIIESPFTTVVVDPAARFSRTLGGALLIET
jgi:N-methylhydantoinase A